MSQARKLLSTVRISPFSVLGAQLKDRRVATVADLPGSDCLFVDPAGLLFIQELGPGAAAGASGAIYAMLGIQDDDEFDEDVRLCVTEVCDARWHSYTVSCDGEAAVRHCCHVVGPNFGAIFPAAPVDEDGLVLDDPSRAAEEVEALALLTTVYRNVLREFVRSKLPKLRLLPVSGGIFAGKLRDVMPELTFAALAAAFDRLDEPEAAAILARAEPVLARAEAESRAADDEGSGVLQMCIFEHAHLTCFTEAFERCKGAVP